MDINQLFLKYYDALYDFWIGEIGVIASLLGLEFD